MHQETRIACQSRLASAALLLCALGVAAAAAEDLPVDQKALEALTEKPRTGLTNLLSLEQVAAAIGDGSGGLSIDFAHVSKLLDGTTVAPDKIYGTAYSGPFPFEAAESVYVYKRFRVEDSIRLGKGTISVGSLLKDPVNSERWTDAGQVTVRFILFIEQAERDRAIGTYDVTAGFKKGGPGYVRTASFREGPTVNLLRSDAPSEAVIAFATDDEVRASVKVEKAGGGWSQTFHEEVSTRRHEIAVEGLEPGAEYTYRVKAGSLESRTHKLRAAPAKDERLVRFGYLGDTRAGPGGGLQSFMGVNFDTLSRLSHLARSQGAAFLSIGGDLVSGYTSVPEDFRTQLQAWNQAVAGFWCERPIYAAMGNHEALLRAFEGVSVDRWPYDTQSAEAVFASMFVHPRNGPQTSDPRRPTYKENVYSFQYGPVRMIAFNNNYWVSNSSEKYGGAPEGYILQDQLDWIHGELEAAEKDETVRYVILYAQEPVFPNGGHLGDTMWAGGDNRLRAHVFKDSSVLPEPDGLIVVRNKLVRMAASYAKVAAVLGADEHAYHHTLIGKDVPIGDIPKDDANLNARIDTKAGEKPSPLTDLKHNVWYIVSGGGGAPYYSEEKTPWNEHWEKKKAPRSGVPGFYYSSQENVLIFEAGPEGISMKALSLNGEVIQSIPNLMLDKDG